MAHGTLCSFLEGLGYQVTRSAYGRPTAFEVLSGSGGRLVNFNAEYDCLPGIGHACGHNVIATSSVAAFLGLSMSLKKLGVPGRVKLLGAPDEEDSGAKIKLLEAGAYKGVDASLMAYVLTPPPASSSIVPHWHDPALRLFPHTVIPSTAPSPAAKPPSATASPASA